MGFKENSLSLPSEQIFPLFQTLYFNLVQCLKFAYCDLNFEKNPKVESNQI